MRLAWVTDLHLNFLKKKALRRFLDALAAAPADALLLGGDVGEAATLVPYLRDIEDRVRRPVYFVLGNHDFYGGSIAVVRGAVRRLCGGSRFLRWLPEAGVVRLSATTALVGHDGWADARLGDFERSTVAMNDYRLIEELTDIPAPERRRRLGALGEETAAFVRRRLPEALDAAPRAIFLTHVPPFREAAVHDGRPSDDNWAPHFACGAAGEALREIMARRPDRCLTVFCGHTHGAGEARILPNLEVITGGAEYGKPAVQRVLEVT